MSYDKKWSFVFLSMALVFSTTLSARAEDVSNLKNETLGSLKSLSQEINVEALKVIALSLSNDEMDVVLYRLKKEIEKVPEFDLNVQNQYDLRTIVGLVNVIYAYTNQDYLSAVSQIRNLANKKLYVFPIYTELLEYQLDIVILKAQIQLSSDEKTTDELIVRYNLTEEYIKQKMQMVLDSVDISKSPTQYFQYEKALSCANLF